MWPHGQHQFATTNAPQFHQQIEAGQQTMNNLGYHRRDNSRESTINASSARASRNLAEKQRRDNLNTNIHLMANLVPTIMGSSRRQDKISILRLAGAYLRSNYTIGTGISGFLPSQFSDIDLEENFLDNQGGGSFLLVTTTTGNIVYVSKKIEEPLGHTPSELIGKSLYDFIHHDDHDSVKNALTIEDTTATITEITDKNFNSTDNIDDLYKDKTFKEQRRNFNIKIAQRTNSRSEHVQYKSFHVSGVLRLADYLKKNNQIRSNSMTNNGIIFVGVAKLMQRRITELSLYDANKQEYITRHLVDGRIIFSDHRIAVVAGYMTEEVSGVNAFNFMHKEDVRYIILALRQMYEEHESHSSSCYRLLSKSGRFIYLKTSGYLEIDKKTGFCESFVCINTLVDQEEGETLINNLKSRFSAVTSNPIIKTNKLLSSNSSTEDPSSLQDAISQLIGNLPSLVSTDRVATPPLDTQTNNDNNEQTNNLSPKSTLNNKIRTKSYTSKKKIHQNDVESVHSNDSTLSANFNSEINRIHSPAESVILCDRTQSIENSPNESVLNNSYEMNFDYMSPKDNYYETVTTPDSSIGDSTLINKKTELNIIDIKSPSDRNSENISSPMNSNGNRDSQHGKSDNMLLYVKTEMMNNGLDKQNGGIKRSFDDDNNKDIQNEKKQRYEFYENNIPIDNSSLESTIKDNSDILTILDELGYIINSKKGVADVDFPNFTSNKKVNETLRQTHSHLENCINYQGLQINELEPVFENTRGLPDYHVQRENFNEIQAEHEMQKKLMKNLQQDHRNVKANLKQNIDV